MPGKGFPPQPTALKILRGNPGKRPLPKREAKPQVCRPPLPEWLASVDPVTKEIFDSMAQRLAACKVMTENDLESLAHLADNEALYRRLRITLETGFTYETTTMQGDVMQRPRPEWAMMMEAKRQIAQQLQQFGMTPASRTKVETVGPEEKSGLEEFLGSGT